MKNNDFDTDILIIGGGINGAGIARDAAGRGLRVTLCEKGDLGAGKTTLVKGMISGMGSQSRVVSPTYTLVEEYQTSKGEVHHLDLYRIKTAEEVESLGFRDRLAMGCIILIEWPERAEDLLPRPEWKIEIEYFENRRKVTIEDITVPVENPHHAGNP